MHQSGPCAQNTQHTHKTLNTKASTSACPWCLLPRKRVCWPGPQPHISRCRYWAHVCCSSSVDGRRYFQGVAPHMCDTVYCQTPAAQWTKPQTAATIQQAQDTHKHAKPGKSNTNRQLHPTPKVGPIDTPKQNTDPVRNFGSETGNLRQIQRRVAPTYTQINGQVHVLQTNRAHTELTIVREGPHPPTVQHAPKAPRKQCFSQRRT